MQNNCGVGMRCKSWNIAANAFIYVGLFLLCASGVSAAPKVAEFRNELARNSLVIPVSTVEADANLRLRVRLKAKKLKWGAPVFIRLFKKEAELEVWVRDRQSYRKLHTYPICYFSGSPGPKLKEGDGQSPEGFYTVTKKQLNPKSRYYRAFNIGFPNEYDRANGRTGSALMVHGNCVSIGCYAMTDPGIGEIYQLVEAALNKGQRGVPVHIFPFKMSDQSLARQPKGKWTPFWQNMKVGHDLFEENKVPPKAYACGKKYRFGKKKAGCRAISGWR